MRSRSVCSPIMRAGDIAFERAHGCAHFDLLERRPEAGQLFHRGMRAYSTQVAAAVIRAYDFSGCHTVLDVGGGQGAFIASLLKAYPALRGKLFDLPAALEQSRSVLEAAGVAERCEIVPGDFFESLPTGADAAVLGRVIHNWDDDHCVRILKNCRAALPTGGRLLIIEYVVTDDADGVAAKLFDLQMLVLFGRARERSAEEYGELLARAAFSLTRVITTPLGISVVEAEAVA
ncbi:MAG: methyltransferase [Steroidobacteraceae bacterium]|nr:methyltransferase [Steroidobacteraceae bacterium]